MNKTRALIAAVGSAALLATACSPALENPSDKKVDTATEASKPAPAAGTSTHQHGSADDSAPLTGAEVAPQPAYPVGTDVILDAGHMPGMKGAHATITGVYATTAYVVSYTPTDGGAPVTQHRWVVQEELENPAHNPLEPGQSAVISANHMPGMKGAQATIDSAFTGDVYMVDVKDEQGNIVQHNHKWFVESEMHADK